MATNVNLRYTQTTPNDLKAMRLQSVGWVVGREAQELKQGDMIMWNFGAIYQVDKINKTTDKFIEITTSDITNPSKKYDQTLKKTRLICILNQ